MSAPARAAAADLGGGDALRPTSVQEAAQTLRGTDGPILFRGGGTALEWGGRVREPHQVMDTGSLAGVLTHNAADLTASVGAGTTLADLQEHLAGHGQWLALDPPTQGAGATLGGLLAAGDSGPSRLRYGGLRDLVIGVTLVLADGTVAKSGGHVIKNVAGYDLAKLVHGSLGSLALVAEVVVRLHPRPATTTTLAGPATVAQAAAAAQRLAASPLEPAAVEWSGSGRGGRLLVRVDSTPRAVSAATRGVRDLLAAQGIAAEEQTDAAAAQLWEAHARETTGGDGDTVLRVGTLPSDLPTLAAHLERAAGESGVEASIASGVALGLHTLRLRGEDEAVGAVAEAIRLQALALGGTVQLRRRPEGVDAHLDPMGPSPTTVELLRRVKAQFDPSARLAPGRFGGWY